MKLFMLIAFFLSLLSVTLSGQHRVNGTVSDQNGGATLIGVNIQVAGTSIGTTTDIDGQFAIDMPSPDGSLVFSYTGFESKTIEINGQSEISITLGTSNELLDEVVVVGYATQRKENLTGAVETIGGETIQKQPLLQASQALAGTAPGVTVIQNSGQPGSTAEIRIRGIGTLGNTNPLVLIDGVPGDINGISPRDIENISVLKDAAAAAIYGSRAANGVILVTTKRGQAGGFQVNYSANFGVQQPTNLPEYLGSLDYLELHNEARQNLGQDPLYDDAFIADYQANINSDPDRFPDVNWIDEVFTENGFQQQHNLSISGGNDIVRVLGSIDFADQNANIDVFNYRRYQARVNTDIKASEKLSFNFDLNARREDNTQTASGLNEVVRQAYRIPPIFASQYSDGRFGPGWNGQNPVANLAAGGRDINQTNYFRALLRATYRPMDDLSISFMYAPEYIDNFGRDFRQVYDTYPNFDSDESSIISFPDRNSLRVDNNRILNNNLNAIVTYEKSFGNHGFRALAGYELITFRRDFFNAFRDNFPLQEYQQINAGAQTNVQNAGFAEEWGLQSFFGRINYDYKGKYLLEANVRQDGSSRFTEANRYGVFPAFSAGWRVSEEPFFSGAKGFASLKLRASWGQLGNQNIGTYPSASIINLGQDFIFGGQPAGGAAQLVLANQNISWETTETTNAGIDLGLFKDRLLLTIDYYVRNTTDILLSLPIPSSIGLSAPVQNAGEVQNRGWDFNLGWRDQQGDFSYGINFNISDVQNEVIDLRGAGPFINGASIIQEGQPINAIFGYETAGYFQNQNDVDGAPGQFGELAPGDIRYVNQITVDTNDDGIPDVADDLINPDDRVVIGDPFPRLTYGINANISYKGFDLSAFVQGVGDRDVRLSGDAVWAFQNAGKIQEWHLDYWRPDNPDADYPRLVATSSHNNFETSDFWVFNAAFTRLRNVTFGYSFPNITANNQRISNLRVYFSGQNLFTISDMPPGIDPEVPNGTAGALFPLTQIFTFGLDLGF
ncbi:MAG: TonB-dependent receptor [Bacteroidota bacterium]